MQQKGILREVGEWQTTQQTESTTTTTTRNLHLDWKLSCTRIKLQRKQMTNIWEQMLKAMLIFCFAFFSRGNIPIWKRNTTLNTRFCHHRWFLWWIPEKGLKYFRCISSKHRWSIFSLHFSRWRPHFLFDFPLLSFPFWIDLRCMADWEKG